MNLTWIYRFKKEKKKGGLGLGPKVLWLLMIESIHCGGVDKNLRLTLSQSYKGSTGAAGPSSSQIQQTPLTCSTAVTAATGPDLKPFRSVIDCAKCVAFNDWEYEHEGWVCMCLIACNLGLFLLQNPILYQ